VNTTQFPAFMWLACSGAGRSQTLLVARGDDVDTTTDRRHADRIRQNRSRRSAVSCGRHKRFNKRFSARPDYVRLVSSTEQVVSAVEEAAKGGRRLVATSGGHCLEGFVSDPEVRVIIDVSPMKRVYYDAEMGAVWAGTLPIKGDQR